MGAVGVGDGEGAVGVEVEFPVFGVELGVVVVADGDEDFDVGGSVVFPLDDVVDFAVFVWDCAAGDGAGGVEGA